MIPHPSWCLSALLLASLLNAPARPWMRAEDELTPLPANELHFQGGFENDIENSIAHWNKGVVPYAAFVEFYRTGRKQFALGEMWGKAVRSGAMFYRYTQDPELKTILNATVDDLLSTRRANGSISCVDVAKQPDGPGGELWERKYVLLGLEEYYEQVDRDPRVLKAMTDLADCTLKQIGPPPKIRIVDQGWSVNRIESGSILEPILRLYRITGQPRYLDFAKYIVEDEGGAKGFNVIEEAFQNCDPEQIGGPYPKAYEMMSLFEGVAEYYRATGNAHWKTAVLNLQRNIREQEITLIGNGGADQPYHPSVLGEAWDHTAREQTNPKIDRMMETCAGVTWLKLCSQVARLTGDALAVDDIEKYAYNGLLGAMKPGGDGFSYVNQLNGIKTNPKGWGWKFGDLDVTCCNLNGPMGLAYLPYVAVMNSKTGPVINLYNAATVDTTTPSKRPLHLAIKTDYPLSGNAAITISLTRPERFALRLRIPGWSATNRLEVNGAAFKTTPGSYALVQRKWSSGDTINLSLDLRCRLIPAPYGSNRDGDNFVALVRGPVVLARDENIDPDYKKPVSIVSHDGYVDAVLEPPTLPATRMQLRIPTSSGFIHVEDYASINNWNKTHVCTWLPKLAQNDKAVR
jgi:hypothetical protein